MQYVVRSVRGLSACVLVSVLTVMAGGLGYSEADAATSAARCGTDNVPLRTFARGQVAVAAQKAVPYSTIPTFTNIAASAKQKIANTSLSTGGRIRDIFVTQASPSDRQGMVAEYVRATVASDIADYKNAVQYQADGVYSAVASAFSNNYVPLSNSKGNVSATRRVILRTQSVSRSGSFALKHRILAGLSSKTIGRFSYTVKMRNRPVVKPVTLKVKYTTCDGKAREAEMDFGTEIKTTPVMEVSYRFTKVRNDLCKNQECQAFSGTVQLLNTDDTIIKTLDVSRML